MKYTSGLVVSGLPPKEYWIDSPIGQTFLCSLILLNVGVGSNPTCILSVTLRDRYFAERVHEVCGHFRGVPGQSFLIFGGKNMSKTGFFFKCNS